MDVTSSGLADGSVLMASSSSVSAAIGGRSQPHHHEHEEHETDEQVSEINAPVGLCSEQSTTSSRLSTPEPTSIHQGDNNIVPIVLPGSPPMHRYHGRSSSGNSLDLSPDGKTRVKGTLGFVDSRQPNMSAVASLIPPPPPPPPPSGSIYLHSNQDDQLSGGVMRPDSQTSWLAPRAVMMPPLSASRAGTFHNPTIPPPPPPPPGHGLRRGRQQDRRTGRARPSNTSGEFKSGQPPPALSSSSRSTSSSTDSAVDSLAARNARVFPPQFPAAPTHRSTFPTRQAAIHNITSWVARYEQSQSPVRSAEVVSVPQREVSITLGGGFAQQSEADTSHYSQDSSVEGIEQLWQLLKEKRARVADIKHEMTRRRRELRALRRRRDDADNALMNLLRPILVNHRSLMHTNASLFGQKLNDVQLLWNDYNQLESVYEGQELMLDEEEEALSYAETRFFSVLATGQMRGEDTAQPRSKVHGPRYPTDVPLDLRGISPDGPTEGLHPRYLELDSALGDLTNARENYTDLTLELKAHEEEIILRNNTNQNIAKETVEFMREYEVEEQRLRRTIDDFDLQAADLRNICEEQGLMRKHMGIGMLCLLNPGVPYEDIDLVSERSSAGDAPTLRHPHFPELLSQPDHLLVGNGPLTPHEALRQTDDGSPSDQAHKDRRRRAIKEYTIANYLTSGGKQVSKPEFVNRWLLQNLRTSPLEVSLLYRLFLTESSLRIKDSSLWQFDVLHYWWRDDTMRVTSVRSTDGSLRNYYGSKANLRAATPPLSRAASDPIGRPTYASSGFENHSEAMTVREGKF